MEIPDRHQDWDPILSAVATRFNREAGIQMGEPQWDLPPDIQQLPFSLASQQSDFAQKLGIPFHQLRIPKKRENCLDLGCGVSFLVYPWSHWEAHFFGHELSDRIVKFIQSRAPQLNSKLFKSMKRGAAHQLESYPEAHFDLVIATGFLYYYPLDYFEEVWRQLKRVIKPKCQLVVEVADPNSVWIDEWGLVELSKGTEPMLTPLPSWEGFFKSSGLRLLHHTQGELFVTYWLESGT